MRPLQRLLTLLPLFVYAAEAQFTSGQAKDMPKLGSGWCIAGNDEATPFLARFSMTNGDNLWTLTITPSHPAELRHLNDNGTYDVAVSWKRHFIEDKDPIFHGKAIILKGWPVGNGPQAKGCLAYQ